MPDLAQAKRWVALDGDRVLIAAALLAIVFAAVVALAGMSLVVVTDPRPVTTLVGSMLGGMLPFITVVLAINQLILTQEFGTTGTFRERLDETDEFRRTVEDDVGVESSPATPTAFLRTLVAATRDRAERLREAADTVDDAERRERVRGFADRVADEAGSAEQTLEGATFGTFEVVSVILDYDDSAQLDAARTLRNTRDEEALPDAVADAVDGIESLLEDVHVARLYFKTVYIQQELANLSIVLLYVGFAALVGGGFVILSYDRLVDLVANRALLTGVVAGAVTLAVAPFAVLLAYVLRIATVARRTAADFGPFMLQQGIPEDQLD
ncbi:hypothetical protein G9464_01670 [Halostella sp. JP-L12]|uniref:hypothetical protein n=1 Tax=Halostella TaxID=1843185 RepID=UPI000EF7A69A|nr:MULTISPECIES: hypothetical protein [Halostella]NHN46309.1 hypothetical protein [Halostella sp. JP-L12]